MKKCNVCGSDNEDAFSNCLICGAPLPNFNNGGEAATTDNALENGVGLSLSDAEATPAKTGLSLKQDTTNTGATAGEGA